MADLGRPRHGVRRPQATGRRARSGGTMRLGAVFPHGQFPTVDPDAVVRLVQRLEDAGYDHLLVYDHVLGADVTNRPGWTGYYDSSDPFLEPLVLFAYIARSCTLELVTDV